MRGLDHPNIVKLVDFSESRQYYFIILELAQGGELFHQIVRLTYFSEDLSRWVIKQVAEALQYLHEEKGVVHRCVIKNRYFGSLPDVIEEISNLRISCFRQSRLYQARTPNQKDQKMKIRSMRESLLKDLAREGLER